VPAVARPTAALEKAGIPTTLIVGEAFTKLANYIGEAEGIRDISLVSFPGVFALETEASFRKILENGTLDDIIAGLTGAKNTATTQTTKSPAKLAQNARDIVVTGTSEEVNRFFFNKKWTDGLPIVVPTKERVEEFLKYTDIPADKPVAVLPPANMHVTPWEIAVNGVMAGCQPEFMPVLIAIVEAAAIEDFNLRNINTTFGDFPFLIINGPIIKQLGFAHDQGAVSLGPNPAVGRFLGLVLRNMAGYRPGETYMGTFGYPQPPVVAEDEEQSPWKPYHVDKGYDPDTSTVTIGATFNWGPQMSFNDVKSPEAGLRWLANYAARIPMAHYSWGFSMTHYTMFLTPPTAKTFAEKGLSKDDVIDYLWKNTTTSVADFHNKYLAGIIEEKKSIRHFLEKGQVDEAIIKEYEAAEAKGPDELLRIIVKKEAIDIVVTGDRGRDKAQWFWTWYNYPATAAIKLPANWDKLLQSRGKPV
jgi:hypothetical protein